MDGEVLGSRAAVPAVIEWPTVALAATIYAAFATLTWFHEAIPGALLFVLGGYVVAWQSSLQHEAVHGHPTPWRAANDLLACPSLWLWLPYTLYRESHLAHHDTPELTRPGADPESFYWSAQDWARLPRWRRCLLEACNTLAGRLLVGPWLVAGAFLAAEVRRLSTGDRSHLPAWAAHVAAIAGVLYWAIGVCGLSFAGYLLLFAYPGTALALLRSYAEHRAHADPDRRTVVVEAEAPFALLFLNNNLHWVHHRYPGLPWYRIPASWRGERDRVLARNGHYLFDGYRAIARRYLWRVKEPPCHPEPARAPSSPG